MTMDPGSVLAETAANVINHVYDDVSRKQEERKDQAEKISIVTLKRNSINDPRKFEVTNDGEKPIFRCVVEWRRAGPDHQDDKFERAGYIKRVDPGKSELVVQENSKGKPPPATCRIPSHIQA